MSVIASPITSLRSVYSTVYSGADQRKHQSSASLAFVREIQRGPLNSPHKGPETRKMFPFDDVIMLGVDKAELTVPLFVFFIGILRCQIFLLYTLHLVLSFECTCLCRCDGFVVACSTVGCLCDNPRGAGGYEIVTMTTIRRNCCRFGEVFVAGCTGNCHASNFHCGRLRKWRWNGDFICFFFCLGE